MKRVLNITDRLEEKRRKEQIEVYREKIETIQRIVQCASCQFKCPMCGQHLNVDEPCCPPDSLTTDYHFCDHCRAEFEAYMDLSSGKKRSDVFWHSNEWMDLWTTWLKHHQAIQEFRKSVVFRKLTEEPDN